MTCQRQKKFDLLAMVFLGVGVWTFLLLVTSLLLFWGTAYAGVATDSRSVTVVPGPATLAGSPELQVSVTYQGDDNANNSILIEWGLSGVDFSLGNYTSATHPAIPFSYTITPLSNSQVYQVRVTVQDGDGQPTAVVKTGLRTYREHLHNALTTGSGTSKWANGWGTADAGSQYGEFTCKTCHDPSSNNIKRIRSSWADGTLPAVPAKTNGVTTIFQSNADGTAQFALDDTSSHSTSNRICESCHSVTNHHRFDSSGLSEAHNGTKDCLGCHRHRTGFSPPACSLCHGGGMIGATESSFWPDSGVRNVDNPGSEDDEGEHVIHMTHLALRDGMTLQNLLDDANSKLLQIAYCERCHGPGAGSATWHYQGDDVGDVVSFQDMDGTADDMAPAGSYASGTCSNVDCHNNKNTASPNWYGGVDNAPCTMCHTADGSNPNTVKADPVSGLHYSASPNGALLHDDSFTGGGECLTCHTVNPTNLHVDGTVQTPDQTTFNFVISPSLDIKLNVLADPTDDTCAANCHSDGKNWYRFWTNDAFDGTVFDTSSGAAITATIQNPLPVRCRVCHGEFTSGWAEGSAHYNMDVDNTSSGTSHNSQNPNINPGAACVDCHLYPDHITPGQGLARHENGNITLTDDQAAPDDFTPKDDQEGARTGVYCADCHEQSATPANGFDSNTFEYSTAFPGWANVQIVATDRNPEYTCFSGANGCHGDTSDNWWPHLEETDPSFFPNRAGAHYEHGTTIGEILAAKMEADFPGSRPDTNGDGKPDALQEDRNKTCNFCHPMAWNVVRGVWESLYHRSNTPVINEVVVDVYGGYKYSLADKTGDNVTGDPSLGGDAWVSVDNDGASGFLYQLEENPFAPGSTYPVDLDGTYYQYLDAYRGDPTVRTGVCSNVACHSNSPFTPQWYGDHQAPGQITDLVAYTHNQDAAVHDIYEWDEPGSVRLYWTAPGDNGHFSGTADEYDVYFRPVANGTITANNLPGAAGDDLFTKRAGGAATVLRQGEAQEMMVEGLTPGVDYNFAIVTKDQPHYQDQLNQGDGIYETLVSPANQSPVSTNASATAHSDNVMPIFWGLDKIHAHDEAGTLNIRYDAAKDHTMPIVYQIWYSVYSIKTHLANGGDLLDAITDTNDTNTIECFDPGDPTTGLGDSIVDGNDYCIERIETQSLSLQVSGLNTGDLYSFIVRAYDGAGNRDDNTVVQLGMAESAPMETTDTQLWLLNNNATPTFDLQADIVNPSWPGLDSTTMSTADTIIWETGTTITRESMVSGISFDVQTANVRRDPILVSVELGYMNGATFTRLGILNDTDVQNNAFAIGKKSTRLQKFALSDYRDIVPANSTLALRLRRWDSFTTTDLTLSWGDSTTKGQLLVNVQPYNHMPNGTFALQLNSPVVRAGGYIDIDWVAADPKDAGQTVHYDVYGSADNGANYPYVIATDVTDAMDLNGGNWGKVTWDTVGDGLNGNYQNCKVKVELGDGYLYEDPSGTYYPDPFEYNSAVLWLTHYVDESAAFQVDNTLDVEPPAAVTVHKAETRPKQGATYIEWTAVGDDGLNHGTRVSYYDIRYRENPGVNGALEEANWDPAVDGFTHKAEGEPVPDFSGSLESFDLLGLAPEQTYDIGVKACDEADNCSVLEPYSVMTATGGPFYCGICHSTPPDEPDTKGTHRQHGYTLDDCAKCHGDGTGGNTDVRTYDGRHYNGTIDIGWAKDSDGVTHAPLVHLGIESGYPSVIITQNTDNNGDVTIYQDLSDGAGGYNMGAGQTSTAYANTDSGTCMNFGSANVNGCHGPFQPQWAPSVAQNNPPKPTCADCHGDKSATRDLDPYGRIWDCNVGGAPSDKVKASPPIDNHGMSTRDDKYTGAHERHLNSSFRFAKQDSCRLCHLDTMYSGEHADGKVDIRFDDGANQSDALQATSTFNGPVATTGLSCGSLSTDSCHDTFESDGVTPKPVADWPVWNVKGAQCDGCHGMSTMPSVPHISDGGTDRACEWCHLPGHPQSPDGINPGDTDALLVNNNPAVGINYKSGGIHIRKVINGRSTLVGGEPIDTLAEICWGCHEAQNPVVSEWGGDDGLPNAAVEPYYGVGQSMYNFGSLDKTSYDGAIWSSAESNFSYKTGAIQSVHSTDGTGVATVTWDAANGRYNETPDAVGKIRCTNCHDVHDLNKADGDTVSGAPYLRGTWKSNPYEEDGAPWDKAYTDPGSTFGAVPRASTAYRAKGGYYIDQNNVRPGTTTAAAYPTSGWTVYSSAGLCILCHDDDVDNMDKNEDEGLWLGENGHSNSTVGGTFVKKTNIFDYSHGRPTPVDGTNQGSADFTIVCDMAAQSKAAATLAASKTYNYAYRSKSSKSSKLVPPIGTDFAYNSYNWGVSIDAGTTDVMFHQFSCSKCHNPHASRLPKLLMTNCLDIRHNTWDDGTVTTKSTQTLFTNTTNDPVDRGMPVAYFTTAQNCHRFDAARGDTDNDGVYDNRNLRGGWNKVTPWVKKNDGTNDEHSGSLDPPYGTSNSTSPWQHSDFPTEPTGW